MNLRIIFAIVFIAQSCSAIKVSKLRTGGAVKDASFMEEIPLRYVNDLILIDVFINGKAYNFLFDTGAELSVIGDHVKKEIDYSSITSAAVETSSMTSKRQEFVELGDLIIGTVSFERTGAVIMDISHFNNYFGCQPIDGILGNNLMRKAAWQIDYENRKIVLCDNSSKLNVSKDAIKINLDDADTRNVYLDLTIDGVSSNFTFDTGYNGSIKSDSTMFNKLKAVKSDLKYISQEGLFTTDVNGKVMGRTYKALGEEIQMEGGLSMSNQIVNFGGSSSSLIGNKVFDDYLLTLDWRNNALFLDQQKDLAPAEETYFEFHFSPNFQSLKIEIVNIVDEEFAMTPISLDTEILAINGVDVSNFSLEELCAYWYEEGLKLRDLDKISMVVMDEDGKREIQLNRKVLKGIN
jgi:hypothetical protein